MEREHLPREGRPVVKSHFVWTRSCRISEEGRAGREEEKPGKATELVVKPPERPDTAAGRGGTEAPDFS